MVKHLVKLAPLSLGLALVGCVGANKDDTDVSGDTSGLPDGDDGAGDDGGGDDGDDGDDTGVITPGDDGSGDDGGGDDGGGDDGGGDDGGSCESFDGTLTGQVRVSRFFIDDDGDVQAYPWGEDEAYDYGVIYIAAYTEDEESGDLTYYADTSVGSPSTDGDTWSITTAAEVEGLRIYAALDADQDRVLEPDEPVGNYPRTLVVCDGDIKTGVDILILVQVSDPDDSGGGGSDTGGGGDGGGGGGSGSVGTIRGDLNITVSYAGGDAAALLLDTSNVGPYAIDWLEPDGGEDGATASYRLSITGDYGEMQLIGGWDSNGNMVLDPTDRWGAYITEPGEDGNPVDVTTASDEEGWDIEVPLDGYQGLEIVPFVRIRGDIDSELAYADYPSTTRIYAAALKYRPSAEVTLDTLEDGYDYVGWEYAEFAKLETLDYELIVPANTITYLWAYADTDADGTLQEPDEPVGSYGTDDGRTSVGTSSLMVNLTLREPPEADTGL